MEKTIAHRLGKITLKDDIYQMHITDGVEINYADAVELIEIGTVLTKGLRVGALVDSRVNYTSSNEARSYFAKNTAQQQFAAVAVITNALPQRLTVNFYIQKDKPNVPTKMFSNEKEALNWLREMLDKKSKKKTIKKTSAN